MNSLAHSGVFWVGLIAGLALLYFLPTMIGIIRKVESLSLPIFLNVLPTGVIFSPHVSQATDLRRLAADSVPQRGARSAASAFGAGSIGTRLQRYARRSRNATPAPSAVFQR